MKKIIIWFLLLLTPMIVFADETNSVEDDTTTTTIDSKDVPDTGVEDYFLTLGIVSIFLGGTLFIVNKKGIFKEI